MTYQEQNIAEVNELMRLGVVSRKAGGNLLICLDENFEDFQHLSVSDRVDLARDLEA